MLVAALLTLVAARLILVSCDPAAAGRDVALLTGFGYRAKVSVVVDLFPHHTLNLIPVGRPRRKRR